MPAQTWGDLAKSQVDNETVEEAIARVVQEHDDDAESHLDEGQSLLSHKASEIIDHIAYSIIEDKIADGAVSSRAITSEQIIGKDIRTAEDVGDEVDGVMMDSSGIAMWSGGEKKVDIPVAGNPTFKGNLEVASLSFSKFVLMSSFESFDGWFQDVGGGEAIPHIGCAELISSSTINDSAKVAVQPAGGLSLNFSKNPFFQTYCAVESLTNQICYITCGEGSSATGRYFGFQITNGNLYAVNRNGAAETSTQITGITLTNFNRYSAVMTSGTNIKYYVNGILVATHTTNLPTTTTSFLNYYYIRPSAASSRTLWISNMLFVQDF